MISYKPSGGDLSLRAASNFRFGDSNWAKGVYQFERHSCGESREFLSCYPSQANSHHGGFQHHLEESTEMQVFVDGSGCEGKMATVVRPSLEDCKELIVGSTGGCIDTNGGIEVGVGKNATNTKGEESLDQMEFEGHGGADAAC